MNRRTLLSLAGLFLLATVARAEPPGPMVTGLKTPESVCVGFGNRIFVTQIGEFDKDGDGSVAVVTDGKAVTFCEGLDDPKGIAFFQSALYVADKKRVWRIDGKGKATVFADAKAFPTEPKFLNDLHIDQESGVIYVSDSGDLKGKGGAVFRIGPKGGRPALVVDATTFKELHTPNGLHQDAQGHLLLADFGTGALYRYNIAAKERTKLADGFGGADGVCWDHFGRLFVSDWKNGKVFVIPRPGAKPILLAEGFKSAADICLDPAGKFVLVPDMTAGTLTAVPIKIPGWEFDDTPLPLETAVAYPDLTWTGWKGETDAGKKVALRPIALTHAGDGSNRVFVATQQGVIHTFPNDQGAKATKIFLDIQDRVRFSDEQNEEGFLGLAFHPKYKENGEFFVFYTPKQPRMTNVVARYKASKDDPDRADPASEEILMTFKKPYWNHDGGTICFGPDGYLYITHGDGGLFNDPHDNGQNLKSLLGKIHRIDVNRKEGGKNYAIPADNPFADGKEGLPEIWAYGLRNVWRMSFDRKTGRHWAADVGQNLWEEINLISKGGNYGWNRREGLHPFGPKGVGPNEKMIDPIWEYHHDIGKSITGGHVYRGPKHPELDGHYLNADYVTGKIWALKYDDAKKRVVANRPVKDRGAPIMSFGEDERGEVYLMTYTPTGKGLFWFVKSKQ